MAVPSAYDLHIAELPPSRWDEIDRIRATENPRAWGHKKRPVISSPGIDWAALGFTPRWLQEDSSEAVAAVEPSVYASSGAEEWRRFVAGAAGRGELVLAVTMIGDPDPPLPAPISFGPPGAHIGLPGAPTCHVGGTRIMLASPPLPAPGIGPADRDLALRLVARSLELPWWTLELSGETMQRGWELVTEPAIGILMPLLVSKAGEVVAAVWTSDDESIRHYVVPYQPSYEAILRWLADRAIPEFVPTAARRIRSTLADEPSLQTDEEMTVRRELAELDAEYERRRDELAERSAALTTSANAIRDPLLYGSGAALVAALRHVLTDAGMTVIDLDEVLGETSSTDLLVSGDGKSVLVEVKSAGGRASEDLVAAVGRHVATWSAIPSDVRLDGAVLVVNHEARTHPLDRGQAVYTRREFVESLTVPVLSTGALFEWWRHGEYTAIRSAFLSAWPKGIK